GAAGGRLGLLLRRGDAHRGRPRASLAGEAARPRPPHPHGEVVRLPADPGRTGVIARFGLRARMALASFLATSAALLTVLIVVGPALRERALDRTRETLLAEARLMAHVVEEPLAKGTTPEELDPQVDAAAREVGARVTIVAPDGRVLGDSAVSGAALLALENHASRPEIHDALRAASGVSRRFSATVH